MTTSTENREAEAAVLSRKFDAALREASRAHQQQLRANRQLDRRLRQLAMLASQLSAAGYEVQIAASPAFQALLKEAGIDAPS